MRRGKTAHRGIAQLVEYRSPKPWVAGSNPPAPAKKATDSQMAIRCFFVGSGVSENPRASEASRGTNALAAFVALPFGQCSVLNPTAVKNLDFSRLFSFFGAKFYV